MIGNAIVYRDVYRATDGEEGLFEIVFVARPAQTEGESFRGV
jgi:hypothetical protein